MPKKDDSMFAGWWVSALAGVLVILFGIAALFWPGITLATFVVLFSAYVLIAGVVAIVRGFMSIGDKKSMWWAYLLFGLVALGVGVYLVRHPGVSFATLILLVGFTFIIQGVVDFIRGLFGDAISATSRTLALIAGVLGVIAGVFMLTQPETAGIAFVWVIGLYALVLGPLLIASAVDEKKVYDAL